MIERTHEAQAYRLVLDAYAQTRGLPNAWVLLSVVERRLSGPMSGDAIVLAASNGWLEVADRRVRLLPHGRKLFANPLGMRLVRREHRPPLMHKRPKLASRGGPQQLHGAVARTRMSGG